MSVYTHLSASDIESLLSHYDLGALYDFTGIESGVENTNYFIDLKSGSTQQRYVLTLFEYLPEETLPFFINFTTELSEGGIRVPAPIRDRQGQALHTLKGKPCLISPCFSGRHLTTISAEHCSQVGTQLAKLHRIGQKSSLQQENQRGIPWLKLQVNRLSSLVPSEEAGQMLTLWQDITSELSTYERSTFSQLPAGLIHGDLFHDNVLFDQGKITGIIDFYNACHDCLLYDLAVTVNDWCINPDLSLNDNRLTAITHAYSQVRSFTPQEREAWPLMLRLAAFRFWISRIITFVHPEQEVDKEHKENQVLNFKDPDEFKKMVFLRSQENIPVLP
ncbi:homoserine kinase [Endozoicomonas lisbonensis]|uniref:Homoserine kinase n=1 Tax=Endozoicomonas lisbonensis TaxID=3120522 RepID=A0ABV2SJ18_9GAMM